MRAFKHILLIIYGVTCLYPFIWMIGTSLKTPREAAVSLQSIFPKETINWDTFNIVWNKLDFFVYFINSTIVSLFAIIGIILIYSMMSFSLAVFQFPGRRIIYYSFIALLLVPGVTILIPLYLNMTALGLNNTFIGVILPMVNGAAPFAIFLLTSYFRSLSRELYESAMLDGCPAFLIYLRIYLPLALPAIGTITIINFIGTWNNVLWPMIIIDSKDMFTLPMGLMFLDSSSFKHWNELMGGALISVLPILLTFPFMQKMYIKGMSLGSTKL